MGLWVYRSCNNSAALIWTLVWGNWGCTTAPCPSCNWILKWYFSWECTNTCDSSVGPSCSGCIPWSRGPVRFLIDSDTSFSALNWNGIDKLGISRDDESLFKRLRNPLGVLGSDRNVAQLTHRIHVSSGFQVGSKSQGLLLKNDKRLPIDIGNIAILDALAKYNVVGILGIDALMICLFVRLDLKTDKMELLLFE